MADDPADSAPLPPLPGANQDPWFTDRDNWDDEVTRRLEGYLSPAELSAKQAQNIAEPGPVRDVLNATIGKSAPHDRVRGLRTWFGALSRAAIDPANVFTISDSILEGYNLGNGAPFLHHQRPTAQILQAIRSRHQPAGIRGGLGYVPVAINGTDQALIEDWPWSGVGLGYATSSGPGFRSALFGPNAPSITLTVRGHTSVDIITKTENGGVSGQIQATLDSGAPVTISVPAGGEVDWKATRITLPDRSEHTIVISQHTGYTFLSGAVLYDGDENAGIRMFEGGHGGWSTADFANETEHRLSFIEDQARGIQPALVIYELGTNLSSNFNTNTPAIIAAVRAGCDVPPSILLVSTMEADAPTNAFMEALAQSDPDITYFDVRTAFLPTTDAYPYNAGDLLSDGLHWSTTGAFVGGALIAKAILP